MNTFLLTGGDSKTRQKYVQDLALHSVELIHIFAEKSTLTIAQIKDLAEPLSTAPRIPRIVWIEEANLLTIPAQNALLKMLEEPPHLTTFYLTCQSQSMLLSTIRSRTQLITLDQSEVDNNPTVLSDLKVVMSQSPGDRLASIVKRDRSESLVWVGEIESALKTHLKKSLVTQKSADTLAKIAHLAQNLKLQLSSNCSVSLATQNFYLLLPHTHSTK